MTLRHVSDLVFATAIGMNAEIANRRAELPGLRLHQERKKEPHSISRPPTLFRSTCV